MFRKLLTVFAVLAGFAGAAHAADDPQLARIAAMPLKELDGFVATIAASVGQDTLKLKSMADAGNCLELTRAANSFALGYGYLAAAREALEKHKEREAQLLTAKLIGSRVVTFAARVRAAQWLDQTCRDFTAPAERAADPRYQPPARLANAEYTDAIVEARQAAEINLAIALGASSGGSCKSLMNAGQNITLLVPYLEKLFTDTANRPEVLGPRASRRALDQSRRQLVATLARLEAQYGEKCGGSKPAQ